MLIGELVGWLVGWLVGRCSWSLHAVGMNRDESPMFVEKRSFSPKGL